MRVGVVGLGGFGVNIAARLVEKDLNPEIYDIDHMAMRTFNNDVGGMITGSPKSMGQSSDLVLTILPSAQALREVFFGWEGLARGLRPGSIVFDMSGCGATTARELAKEIEPTGATLIDAPAIGTAAQARAGSLTLLVGGDEASVERCRSVLDALARRVLRVGGVGAGHAMVALGGYLRATSLLAVTEALVIGRNAGLDPDALLDVVEQLGDIGSNAVSAARTKMLPRAFNSGLALRQALEDLGNSELLLGPESSTPPLLAANELAWRSAATSLGSGADMTAILGWIEKVVLTQPEKTATAA